MALLEIIVEIPAETKQTTDPESVAMSIIDPRVVDRDPASVVFVAAQWMKAR